MLLGTVLDTTGGLNDKVEEVTVDTDGLLVVVAVTRVVLLRVANNEVGDDGLVAIVGVVVAAADD